MSIGEKIRSIRNQQNLTVSELSKQSGVPEKTIYRIETGEVKDPKISSIKPVIKALNCSADEIIFDQDDYFTFGELRRAFANASELPEHEIETLIIVIQKFCFATAMSKYVGENMTKIEDDK